MTHTYFDNKLIDDNSSIPSGLVIWVEELRGKGIWRERNKALCMTYA